MFLQIAQQLTGRPTTRKRRSFLAPLMKKLRGRKSA
jgi:hypothetical protein